MHWFCGVGSLRGRSQGHRCSFQAVLLHPCVLRLGACSKLVEIHAAQPGIRRSDYRQGPPQRLFSEDAEPQGFQCLEGAEITSDAAP